MLLGMAVAATARPRAHVKRDTCIVDTVALPGTSDIQAAITSWNNDVNNVNSFLNDAQNGLLPTGDALQQRASDVLASASDEPCQLQTLANVVTASNGELVSSPRSTAVHTPHLTNDQNTIAYQCAIGDLENVFQTHVLFNLQQIVDNPDSADIVSGAVADINLFRCCNVLPDASILWLDSAVFAQISDEVPTCAAREDACANISCGTSCRVDNGPFGPGC